MEKKELSKEISHSKALQNLLCIFIVLLTVALIAISILIYVDIEKASRKTRIECQVVYLKDRGITDESFDSVGDYYGTDVWCHQRMIRKMDEIEYEAQERLMQVAGHRSYTICMINRLKDDTNYINKVIFIEILEFTRVSWSFWTFFDRNARLKILEEQLCFLEADALSYCKGDGNSMDVDGSGWNNDDDSDAEGSGFDEAAENGSPKSSIRDKNLVEDDLYFEA
jgi:hypothetical protein